MTEELIGTGSAKHPTSLPAGKKSTQRHPGSPLSRRCCGRRSCSELREKTWSHPNPETRGPAICTVRHSSQRNAIGAHQGSYCIYTGLAVAAGTIQYDTIRYDTIRDDCFVVDDLDLEIFNLVVVNLTLTVFLLQI